MNVRSQSALFRKVRFSSPGQTRRRLTEKRILRVAPHGKAHSAYALSRKSAFWWYPSRKSALCMRAVTQTAPFRHGGTAWGSECAFPSRRGHRVRLCVSVWGQNALFRKLRFSSPGQTRRHLTEKRILRVPPHGKAHSVRRISRKSAFCVWPLTERRILGGRGHGKAHSGDTPSRKSALCTSDLTEKRTLHASGHADCAFPSRWDRVDTQTALFRHDAATECVFT